MWTAMVLCSAGAGWMGSGARRLATQLRRCPRDYSPSKPRNLRHFDTIGGAALGIWIETERTWRREKACFRRFDGQKNVSCCIAPRGAQPLFHAIFWRQYIVWDTYGSRLSVNRVTGLKEIKKGYGGRSLGGAAEGDLGWCLRYALGLQGTRWELCLLG